MFVAHLEMSSKERLFVAPGGFWPSLRAARVLVDFGVNSIQFVRAAPPAKHVLHCGHEAHVRLRICDFAVRVV